jgi:hypothetical protein
MSDEITESRQKADKSGDGSEGSVSSTQIYQRYKYLAAGLVLFFILFNVSFYMKERQHWINSNHAHLEAKEYFVLGKMVFFYRKIIHMAVKINSPIMSPLNTLQQVLYDKGTALLPESDGERAVWKYHFFLYFYGKGFLLPEDETPRSLEVVSPHKVKLLDDIYRTLEELATKPVADNEMNKMRHKAIPLVAMLYQGNQTSYFGNIAQPARLDRLIRDKVKFDRIYRIIDIMNKNKIYIDSNNIIKNDIAHSEYQVEMFHYLAMLGMLTDVIFKNIETSSFKCSDQYNEQYIQNRYSLIQFMQLNKTKIPKNQYELLYSIGLESGDDPFKVYLLSKHCKFDKDEAYPHDEFIEKSLKHNWNIYFEKKMLESIAKNK